MIPIIAQFFRKKVTVAIVCSIAIIAGLCGLAIYRKKHNSQSRLQCNEDEWNSVTKTCKDEHSFLNGKTQIQSSCITVGKLLGTKSSLCLKNKLKSICRRRSIRHRSRRKADNTNGRRTIVHDKDCRENVSRYLLRAEQNRERYDQS